MKDSTRLFGELLAADHLRPMRNAVMITATNWALWLGLSMFQAVVAARAAHGRNCNLQSKSRPISLNIIDAPANDQW